MASDDPYLTEIRRTLPRLLALYDDAPASPTYGFGDRLHWAWKLSDYANGTFQGACHGLALLIRLPSSEPALDRRRLLDRIDAMFQATQRLTRRNGSLEEAFPYEASFCVTALVAHDLLNAVHALQQHVAASRIKDYLGIVRPLIAFLERTDEAHGFISNHLATAAAAILRWHLLTGQGNEESARRLVASILASASAEGWFLEYEGADPGYQTLCMSYLADIHLLRPEWGLDQSLRRGFAFLGHFVHPDGSFGGHYGSRNTRFYFPCGAERLAESMREAAALAAAMRESIADQRTVVLSAVDEPNLVPMFNSYCRAAAARAGRRTGDAETVPRLPAYIGGAQRTVFPAAGLLVDRGPRHYTIVSWRKGGVCYHFKDGQPAVEDLGVVVRDQRGRRYSSQFHDAGIEYTIEADRVVVRPRLTLARQMLPSPSKFIVLRLLCLTAFRIPVLSRLIKRAMVRLLITGRKSLPMRLTRTIELGFDLAVRDEIASLAERGLERCDSRRFSAIHMASQGYWQAGDDRP